jgi:hypothetical protein
MGFAPLNPSYGYSIRHKRRFFEVRMNQELEIIIARIKSLPDERQQEVAQVLLALLDEQDPNLLLSPEQIAEIERLATDDGPYATNEEVREVFARLTNGAARQATPWGPTAAAEKKLEKIAAICNAERKAGDFTIATHALVNLEGAIVDLERTRRVDDVCLNTLNRVREQLREIGEVLGI